MQQVAFADQRHQTLSSFGRHVDRRQRLLGADRLAQNARTHGRVHPSPRLTDPHDERRQIGVPRRELEHQLVDCAVRVRQQQDRTLHRTRRVASKLLQCDCMHQLGDQGRLAGAGWPLDEQRLARLGRQRQG